ncbi:ER membrane protein complex subunit 8/9 homolog [Impatiens glandulifera]|uniref:ER membrane protein complex subunit 8/9 homolog n=1 Tax=Impatiens glandulifera TaxID=253017 RepID=UPI001FB10553|nr:ER membrane protein complex subunit 8/9 homolog [Impatiens glandulifera]
MGSGEVRYVIAQNAYIKLILHAIKHKTSAVNGILLGRFSSSSDTDPLVEITDSVPLFHSQIGLLPPLEIALNMTEEFYSAQGLSIVGYFHANERFDDFELSNVAKNIGDQIHRYFPQSALLLLDNKKLEALPKSKERSPVMQLYSRDASRWKLLGSGDGSSSRFTTKEPTANILLLDYISSEKWNDIVDFDDHLDDISKDWVNADLFSK